jgi:proteasome lid subunit RPN8/RPN11
MLYVGAELLHEMITHAESTTDECCGFLIGLETSNDHRTLEHIIATNNISPEDRSHRFEIAPLAFLRAEQFADRNDLQLLGIYHSHPNHLAIPSELDRISAQPGFSNVIISLINNKFAAIRSWRLNNDRQFEEEKITHPIINYPPK